MTNVLWILTMISIIWFLIAVSILFTFIFHHRKCQKEIADLNHKLQASLKEQNELSQSVLFSKQQLLEAKEEQVQYMEELITFKKEALKQTQDLTINSKED